MMTSPVEELTELAAQATPAAVELARVVLEQSIADDAWAAQLGPALTQAGTAQLLGKSEQAVSKDPRLLRIRNRDGRPVYPVFQFDGRAQLPGVAEVLATLTPALLPLSVASWLTGDNRQLGGRRPVDLLRGGDLEAVRSLARQLAASAA